MLKSEEGTYIEIAVDMFKLSSQSECNGFLQPYFTRLQKIAQRAHDRKAIMIGWVLGSLAHGVYMFFSGVTQ